MPTNESLMYVLDKAYEQKSLKELVTQSPEIFEGLTAKHAELLQQALGVKTIADLANNKHVRWAQALVTLAEVEKLPQS